MYAFPMIITQAKEVAEDYDDAHVVRHTGLGDPHGGVVTENKETFQKIKAEGYSGGHIDEYAGTTREHLERIEQ